jgi:hypothetical protein
MAKGNTAKSNSWLNPPIGAPTTIDIKKVVNKKSIF